MRREIPPGRPCLIGDDQGEKSVLVQEPNGFDHAGEQYEAAQMIDVAHLLVDGTVAVQKDCWDFQCFPSH